MNTILRSCAAPLLALATFAVPLSNLRADGTVDPAFHLGRGCNGQVSAVIVQPDGKIVIAGSFTKYHGATAKNIARLNPNGSLDTTFSVGTGLTTSVSPVNVHLALQTDGHIIVGGSFTALNGYAAPNLIRIDAEGKPDPEFTPPADTGNVTALALDDESNLYIANDQTFGTYEHSAGVTRFSVIGILDPTFEYPLVSGTLDRINTIVPQADGTIFIGGSINNAPNTGVVRLKADGSVDSAFAANSHVANGASAIAVQPNGDVIVAYQGAQSPLNNREEGNVIRLRPNGTVDPGFHANAVPPRPAIGVNAMLVESDGKILLGGGTDYSKYPGVNRLNANGSLDTTFNPGAGASDTVFALALEPLGGIVVGGDFTDFDHVSSNAVALLTDSGPVTVTVATGVAATDESSHSPATFIVKLSAAQAGALTIHYRVAGSAVAAYDYERLSGEVTIKAGKKKKTIDVTPINHDVSSDATLTVKLTLNANSSYTVGPAGSAKVRIIENQ